VQRTKWLDGLAFAARGEDVAALVATETPKTRVEKSETIRAWLFKTFFTNLCGITFPDWCEVLRDNEFAIDPRYWPRAAILTAGSALNSYYRRREDRAFASRLANVEIKPPLFILGHWRSGTTLLHTLLALDDQFAYPNLYQVFFPHTFLSTEDVRMNLVRPLIPHTRAFDNVAQGLQMPNEDEFGTCTASICSPYMAWSFPRRQDHYERYLTFRGVPEAEVARWKDALVRLLKKLTWKYDRPLLLKSPPHTCRIRRLLELFPDARFVHIHRNPYTVFQSTKHLNEVLTRSLQFQHPRPGDLDAAVLRRYQVMHDVFFEERSAIPPHRYHELAFEDLEDDPVGQIRLVYERLGLEGIDAMMPRLEEYVESLAGYRKNEYPNLPERLRDQIRHAWGRCFEEWGYPTV
jgi:hypothetical protein